MSNTEAKQAMEELTMILLYLSRFQDRDLPDFKGKPIYHAWKGYDFEVLNQLDDKDYIDQGRRPSRRKSVYITEEEIEEANKLMEKYGIKDW